MSAQQTATTGRADPLAWARALRSREHELGLRTPRMTRHARALWRDVLAAELTPEEQASGPRAFTRRK